MREKEEELSEVQLRLEFHREK